MINMKYLHYFQVLAGTEHYGSAAEILGIAQPSLSYAMDNLEKELGIQLFERTGRNVRLTEGGTEYLRYVNQALMILEQGREASGRRSRNTLRIGYISSVREEVYRQLRKYRLSLEDRDIYPVAYEGLTQQLQFLLSQDKLDLLLASAPAEEEEFVSIPWREQKLVVVSSRPLPEEGITPDQAAKLPLITHTMDSGMGRLVERMFTSRGLIPDRRGEASEDQGVLSLVKLSFGSAIMTDSAEVRGSNLFVVPLLETERARTVYIVIRRGHSLSPAAKGFMDQLRR